MGEKEKNVGGYYVFQNAHWHNPDGCMRVDNDRFKAFVKRQEQD
jgi:hypothetical protein